MGASMTDQWCTYTDAATLTGVPEATIRWWVHRGRAGNGRAIATATIGRRLYVALHDVRLAERDSRLTREQS